MPISTIEWKNNKVRIIDQTRLPQKLIFLDIDNIYDLRKAIRKLKVRGAPAIGVAGAFGVLLSIKAVKTKDAGLFIKNLNKVIDYLVLARPTAVNLSWALTRMKNTARANIDKGINLTKSALLKEAKNIMQEDKESCRKMAEYGARLIKKGDRILTHCNAGGLATVDYGTALGVLFKANEQKKKIKVFVDETRPLLQGSRLTAWELLREHIDATLICDNMAASLMEKGKIDKILVGADRITANGDVANKIGTYNLAVLADFHKIPLYVVAPLSTFDISLSSGAHIPIEQRNADEVRQVLGKKIAPQNIKVYNPAFDVTPHRLIAAIITDKGILYPPFKNSFKKIKRFIKKKK